MIPFFDGNITELITTIGYVGLFIVVFAESGFFLAPFLPGDSLLFSAGILAAEGYFSLYILIPIFVLAAIFGDSFGYWFGKRFGKKMFEGNIPYLNVEHLEKTRLFYEKHGAFSITIARFVPIVRTFTPIFAGAAEMHYRTFITYNILGAILWGAGVTLLGFFLGKLVPNIEHYLVPIFIVIVLASLVPIYREYRKSNRRS
jgi:membrane-associated protein